MAGDPEGDGGCMGALSGGNGTISERDGWGSI